MTDRSLYLYERRGSDYVPTDLCVGPWSGQTQNGAMVAGLLAQVLDSTPTRIPMIPMDFHLEILKPVPFAPLTIDVRVVRDGQKLQVLQASLRAGTNEIALATLVKLRNAPEIAPVQSIFPHSEPLPETLPRMEVDYAYFQFVDIRLLRGAFNELGPGAAWMRVCGDILAGSDNTSLGALALCADAGSGLAAFVSRSEWVYPNVSLAIHMHRPMTGKWALMDSTTRTQGHGVAQIHSTLSDTSSSFGQVQQSVIFEPIGEQHSVRPSPFGG